MTPQPHRIYINDGNGVFTDESGARIGSLDARCRGVELGDIDNDGDLDIIFANGGGFASPTTPQPQRIYINDGTGVFTHESGGPSGSIDAR